MSDQYVILANGQKVDCEELTVGGQTVLRQRTQTTGAAAGEIAKVSNAAPTPADYGLVVRPIVDNPASEVDATTTITSTTETTVCAAGASGVFHDLTTLVVANTSATGVRVDFRDATGGTVRLSLYCPGRDTRGIVFARLAKKQTTAANNWTAQSSAAVTDLRVYVQAMNRT